MDPFLIASLVVMAAGYIAKRIARTMQLSDIAPTDAVHFALGMFAARLAYPWAYLVTALYLAYQIAEYIRVRDALDKDIMTYTAGLVIGLGGPDILHYLTGI
jgi:hypothetical protein